MSDLLDVNLDKRESCVELSLLHRIRPEQTRLSAICSMTTWLGNTWSTAPAASVGKIRKRLK